MLRMSYVIAVRNNLYFVLGAASLALVLGACMEWRRMEVAAAKAETARSKVAEQAVRPAASSGKSMTPQPID